MKMSMFNSILKRNEDNSLLYNSFTNRFIIIKNTLLSLVSESSNINEIEVQNNEVYQRLLKSGWFVEDKIDEIQLVKNKQLLKDNNTKSFHLIINTTLDCNFRCWYCYESHVLKSRLDNRTRQGIKNLLKDKIISGEINFFSMSFFGGEPLIDFDAIISLTDYAYNLCKENNVTFSFGMTSNGYLLNASRIEKLTSYGISSIQITLDGDRDTHNKVRFISAKMGSYDRIVNNVKELAKSKVKVSLRINYTSENILSMMRIPRDFDDIDNETKSNIHVKLYRVWQDTGGADIEDSVNRVIDNFHSTGFQTHKNILDGINKSCYADKWNGAVINYNGDVFRCTARDFESSQREGFLEENGKIIWENDSQNRRRFVKFKNPSCLKCRILPICNGGCSQIALEKANKDYCIFHGSEEQKDRIILERLVYYYRYRECFLFK